MGNVRYIDYFDEKDANGILANKALYGASIELMNNALNNVPNEELILLCNTTFDIMKTSQNNTDTVKFTDEMKNVLLDSTNTNYYSILHNHPSGGTFSFLDIEEFLKYSKLRVMIAISNDCNEYYALCKENVNNKQLFDASNNIYKRFNSKGYGHAYFTPLIEVLQRYGVSYNWHIFKEE